MNTTQGLLSGVVVLIVIGVGAYFLLNAPTPSTSSNPTGTETSTNTNGGSSGTGSNTTTGSIRTPGKPLIATNQNPAVSNSTAVVSGSVTPNGSQTTYWYEYGRTSSLGNSTVPQTIGSGYIAIAAPAYITGLSANTTYYYRLIASNASGTVTGASYTFATNTNPPPQGTAPTVGTDPATAIDRTSAKVVGRVTPGNAATTYWFEYGTNTSLGDTTSILSAGNGTSPQTVSASLSNLQPGTKYYFRLNAQNQFGTVNGAVLSFTTDGPALKAPVTDTTATTNIATSSAKFNGTVNPGGAETTYWFEYGTDSLLGTLLGSTAHTTLGSSGTSKIEVSATISNLSSNTRYYVRLVATNSQGNVRGDIVNFKTK